MYRHILFDADDTLFDFKQSEKKAFELTINYFKLPFSEENYQLYTKINAKMWQMLENKQIGKDELRVKRFVNYLDEVNEQKDAELMNEVYTRYLAEQGILFEDALDVLKQCKRLLPCSIATNGVAYVQRRRIEKAHLESYFDHLFISEELQAEKPDLKFFERIFECLKIENPKEILFVGDSLNADIKGGVSAGCTTVWYNPKHKKNLSEYQPDYEIVKLDEILKIIED